MRSFLHRCIFHFPWMLRTEPILALFNTPANRFITLLCSYRPQPWTSWTPPWPMDPRPPSPSPRWTRCCASATSCGCSAWRARLARSPRTHTCTAGTSKRVGYMQHRCRLMCCRMRATSWRFWMGREVGCGPLGVACPPGMRVNMEDWP